MRCSSVSMCVVGSVAWAGSLAPATASEERASPQLTDEQMKRPFFSRPFLLGAHRGGEFLWPENTAVAFAEAARRWPDILLESDARLTADGQVVLMHDKTVDRTTDGTGTVESKTLAELKRLDAGYRFTTDGGRMYPHRGKGVKVATLAEALAAAPDSRFEIELKAGGPGEAIADAAVGVIRQAKAENRVLLCSFVPRLMARTRALAPNVATCYDYAGGNELLKALRGERWEAYRPTAHVLSMMVEMLPRYRLTPEEIRKIRAKGIYFQIHTLNDAASMRHWLSVGVDSILTDRPDLLAEQTAR